MKYALPWILTTTLYTVNLFASTQVSESSTDTVVVLGFSITSSDPELDLPLPWLLLRSDVAAIRV